MQIWIPRGYIHCIFYLAISLYSVAGLAGTPPDDFGLGVQKNLAENSPSLFGVQQPVSASTHPPQVREPEQKPTDILVLAEGLQADFLTREAAHRADMFAFWPDDAHPTHLVFCIEANRAQIKPGKWNPSIQRIDISNGQVTTVLRGMHGCDGIRRTPWGTLLATEERGDGHAYELLDPIAMNNVVVVNREKGELSEAKLIARRNALPTMAWEGLAVLSNGVVIAGDELRPGSKTNGEAGGAIYKFVPTKPAPAKHVQRLEDSPLVAGKVYALRVDCQADSHGKFPQYGQGCEVGNGSWVKVNAASARADAKAIGATGYYRPEDLEADPLYTGAGVRFCWTNTGNKDAGNYGEVMCGIDSNPTLAEAKQASVSVQRFIEGDLEFNSVDNLAFQPRTGNLYVLEDDTHGEIYACLPDGGDRDLKSDGCVRILALKDPTAEPTGFAFSADGQTAYLSIQHSDDALMPLVDDYPTDDIVRIRGFKIPRQP